MEAKTAIQEQTAPVTVHLVGLDIFTKKKYDDICPASHSMQVPEIRKCDMQLVAIGYEGGLTLMDENGYLEHHHNLPEGSLGAEIRDKYDTGDCVMVVMLKALGMERIHGYKIVKD